MHDYIWGPVWKGCANRPSGSLASNIHPLSCVCVDTISLSGCDIDKTIIQLEDSNKKVQISVNDTVNVYFHVMTCDTLLFNYREVRNGFGN